MDKDAWKGLGFIIAVLGKWAMTLWILINAVDITAGELKVAYAVMVALWWLLLWTGDFSSVGESRTKTAHDNYMSNLKSKAEGNHGT